MAKEGKNYYRPPVLKRPHVTEKSSSLSGQNVYCFVVDSQASKQDIKQEVEEVYQVRPVKIRVVYLPNKKVFGRGRRGTKAGIKKAYVYLKEGEKIDFT